MKDASHDRVPTALALLVVAIFVPEACGFFLFNFRFTVASALLLALAPTTLFTFASLIASGRFHFAISDLLMPLVLVWMFVAPAQIEPLGDALTRGGSDGLAFVIPYMLARSRLQTAGQLHRIVQLFCLLAGAAGVLAILDTLTEYHVLREGLAQITGYNFYHGKLTNPGTYYRLGLFRAQGPLEQPIMLGISMCYGLMLSRDAIGWPRALCRVGCSIGLFLSLSSAPWNALAVGIALTIYGRAVRYPHKWLTLLAVVGAIFGTIFILSANPLGWIFNHFTLDPATGYIRLLTWDYAGADVLTSPIFGIGTGEEWPRPTWMPLSVDSLWLRLAMKYGIPGALLVALALIGSCSLRVMRTPENAQALGDREVLLAETLEIVTILTAYLGFTVFYWGSCWTLVGLLAGMRAFLGQLACEVSQQVQRPPSKNTSLGSVELRSSPARR